MKMKKFGSKANRRSTVYEAEQWKLKFSRMCRHRVVLFKGADVAVVVHVSLISVTRFRLRLRALV